ncbi:substrate-binding domain-containing protein [Streptomyces sp. KR80]|uniref:substrate-binding domain-containing protein n=1 Tax=Streptomyces sp. KR80 TaxID=3457426 RepID=UPI003FD3FD51
MGRHSLPHGSIVSGTGAAPRPRRRGLLITVTALVLAVATGTVVASPSDLLPFGKSCDGQTMRLRVVASPAIAPALRTVADRARDDGFRTDGRCLDVRVTARAPHVVADELGQADADPAYEVWVPDSSLWVERSRASGAGAVLGDGGNVASSPLVLAAAPSAAEKLGWPTKTYTWAEVVSAAGAGDFRLSAADPARSATGLLALERLNRSTGAKDEKAAGAHTRVAAAAQLLAETAADDDEGVFATLPRDDSGAELGNPHRSQALIVSEQAAHARNTADHQLPDIRLFHPKDGPALLDFPYVLVDDNVLTAQQTRAATRFATMLGTEDSRAVLHDHGFRTEGMGLRATAVRAAGASKAQPYAAEPVDPPSADALEAVLGTWTVAVQGSRITTVVDASFSMSEAIPGRKGQTRMDVTKASLLQALAGFTAHDEIGLWKFARRLDGDRDHRVLVPPRRLGGHSADGTSQRDRLAAAVTGLAPIPGGATGLYDTVLAAYREASASYEPERFNVVVVLTDGVNQDPGGISRAALLDKLEELADPKRPVLLFAIAMGPDADREECEQIAAATGGSAYQVDDPAQIHTVVLEALASASRR